MFVVKLGGLPRSATCYGNNIYKSYNGNIYNGCDDDGIGSNIEIRPRAKRGSRTDEVFGR